MLYVVIFGGLALVAVVAVGWAYWAGQDRTQELTQFAQEQGLELTIEQQPADSGPRFALMRPEGGFRAYVTERLAWPDDDDSVFVFTVKTSNPTSGTTGHLARTCVLTRLPVKAPSLRLGRTGPGRDRDWMGLAFESEGDACTLAMGDTEFDSQWVVTTPNPEAAADFLTSDVRSRLVTIAVERPRVEMELSGRWLLCDVGPKSTPLDQRLDWLEWAKRVPTHLFGDVEG